MAPLRRLGLRARRAAVLEGALYVLCAALGLLVAQYLADRLLRLEVGPRAVLLAAVVGTVAVQCVRRVIRPWRRQVRPDAVASILERRRPQGDELLSAVQFALAGAGDARFNSPDLVGALIERASARFADAPLADVVDTRRARRALLAAGAALTIVTAAAWADSASARVFLMRNYLLSNTPWPSRTRLKPAGFIDRRMRWPRGDPLTLVVDAEGEAPTRGVRMEYRSASGQRGERSMASLGPRRFRLDFGPLDESMTVRFVIDGFGIDERSDDYRVEALARPAVESIEVRVSPPEYARQEAYRWPAGQVSGDVLAGSRTELIVRANKPLESATLMFGGQPLVSASRRDDRTWSAEITPTRSGAYAFDLMDADGLKDVQPVSVVIRLTRDRPPRVRLLLPGAGSIIVSRAVLRLDAEIEDNLGLGSADLMYDVERAVEGGDGATTRPATTTRPAATTQPAAPARAPTRVALAGLERYQTRFVYQRPFNLAPLGLQPQDRLTLYCLAADLNPDTSSSGTGPDALAANEGRSTVYSLRIVTAEELLAELARRESEWRQEFEAAYKAQEKLRTDAAALVRQAADGKLQPADLRAGSRELGRRQRQQINRVKTVRRQYQDVLAELEVNQLATPQVRRRLEGGVITPMSRLIDSTMAEAAGLLEQLEKAFVVEVAERHAALQDEIIASMETILSNMLRWEGFNEAVGLLQELLKLQSDVRQQTEVELERQVDTLFGTPATTQPGSKTP